MTVHGRASSQRKKAPAPPVFQAGAATSNITPNLGSSINGAMVDFRTTSVHDELHARCLVLDDGKNRLAFAVCDSCMLPREVTEEARSLIVSGTGIPAANILISATHAHSCGTCTPVFQSQPNPQYVRFVVQRIVDGVRRAFWNRVPAKIGWGAGQEPSEVFNRRWRMKAGADLPDPFGGVDHVKTNPAADNPDMLEPAGPTDPELPFLSVITPEGRPLALMANYSLHYVGWGHPNEISADYFGMFADRVQELLKADRQDPPFVGIMSNGTSGDINNVNFRVPRETLPSYEKMRRVAQKIATEVVRLRGQIVHHDWVPLAAVTTQLSLRVRKPTEKEVARAKDRLLLSSRPYRTLDEIYAAETLQLAEYPDRVPVMLQALRIGELAIAAVPCEVFAETGLELKKESPIQPTFTISLANGYNGYLPTPEHHTLGGYETWRARSSYLEVNASRKITKSLLRLLAKL